MYRMLTHAHTHAHPYTQRGLDLAPDISSNKPYLTDHTQC